MLSHLNFVPEYYTVAVLYKSLVRTFRQNGAFLLILATKRRLCRGNKTRPNVTKVNEFPESMTIKRSSKRLRNIVGN